MHRPVERQDEPHESLSRDAALANAPDAASESGLPRDRLTGERGRTCGQLRMFADLVRSDPAVEYVNSLPDADKELYKKYKAREKTEATLEGKKKLLPFYLERVLGLPREPRP